MNESPAAMLYAVSASASSPMAVFNGVAPTTASALLMAGLTSTHTASFLKVATDGTLFVSSSTTQAEATPGTPIPSKAMLIAGSGSTGNLNPIYVNESGSVGTFIRSPDNNLTADVGTDNVLRVGRDVLLFQDTFDVGINPNIWNVNSSSASANFVNIISGAVNIYISSSTPSGSAWLQESAKQIAVLTHWPATFGSRLKFSSFGTGSIFSFGFLTSSVTTGDSFSGYYFRVDATGSLNFVINANGAEVLTFIQQVPIGTWRNYHAEIGEDRIFVQSEDTDNSANSVTRLINRPGTLGTVGFSHLPFCYKARTVAVVTGTTDISIDHMGILRNDLDSGYDWEHVMAGMGRNCVSDPFTFNQATNYTISTGPVTASYSTTTPMYTTLGGNFAVAAVSASETDYQLFGYRVPEGFQLYVRTITINGFNFGASNAGTPTVMQFALGVNSNTASLLTPAPYGPRVIPLGTTFLDVNVKVGTIFTPGPITYAPTVPICVDSGKYLHILLKVPVGLATNNQILRGTVAIDGYFH